MDTPTPASLPETSGGLRAWVFSMQSELEQHAARITALSQTVDEYKVEKDRLAEYVRWLKSKRFGPSSERSGAPSQRGLFNEAEALLDAIEQDESESEDEEQPVPCEGKEGGNDDDNDDDNDAEIEVPAPKRRRGKRAPLPDFLPRIEIVHDLAEHEKVCGNDPSHALVCIGERTSERLAYGPAPFEVERPIRPEYGCPKCQEGIACEPPAPSLIPKSMATASLLAQIAPSQ